MISQKRRKSSLHTYDKAKRYWVKENSKCQGDKIRHDVAHLFVHKAKYFKTKVVTGK